MLDVMNCEDMKIVVVSKDSNDDRGLERAAAAHRTPPKSLEQLANKQLLRDA